MWTGKNVEIPPELRGRPIGAFYAMPAGFSPGLTVADVMEVHQHRFEAIEAAFRAAKSRI
jgi:hypothetical protein